MTFSEANLVINFLSLCRLALIYHHDLSKILKINLNDINLPFTLFTTTFKNRNLFCLHKNFPQTNSVIHKIVTTIRM